MNYKAPGRRI